MPSAARAEHNLSPAGIPAALTIAGSDSGGGAGIQADLLTFAAHGVYATSAIACLTAQNPDGVSTVAGLDSSFVRAQMEQVAAFYPLRAVKTGMLLNASIIEAVVAFLEVHPELPVVVDPVMVASSGARLLEPSGEGALIERLVPRAALLTPNLDEAAVLLGCPGERLDSMDEAARQLARRYRVPVLLKGGHAPGSAIRDLFRDPSGEVGEWRNERIENVDTHGSGCTLSSAIAARLALGQPMAGAIGGAREYLLRAMRHPVRQGGRAFINHGVDP